MASAVTYPRPSIDLLHGGAQLADLSLLATRARSATLRAIRDEPLDDLDQLALERMAAVLDEAAGSLEYFESAGTRGTLPSGALAAGVDAAIDAAETLGRGDAISAAAELAAFAQTGRQVAPGVEVDQGATQALSEFLERLSAAVTKQLGSVGEERLGY